MRAIETLEAVNGSVLCDPFPSRSLEKVVSKGFATAKQASHLISTKVRVGNSNYPMGSTVWLLADAVRHQWASGKYTCEDFGEVEFIMVPESSILVVSHPDFGEWDSTENL